MEKLVLLCLLFVTLVHTTPGFPPNFLWGTATAAYQCEGAWNISRGLSIWDVFSHTPGKTRNGETGDVADDQYHRYEEDIAIMKSLGLKHYRLSIAWPRLFPNGTGTPNQDAIVFYNKVINSLIANGLSPFVTLYHWDLPNQLHTSYRGWLDEKIVNDFGLYVETAFRSFGDRVKHWITFNEPTSFINQGYGSGAHAPGRCSNRTICTEGDSATEPYIVAHNVLLSHARAVDIYRRFFQPEQKGAIGITLIIDWAEPLTNSSADFAAAERHMEWQAAWYADPIFRGDYPESMKIGVGSRLPVFTEEQKRLLRGSWDYFGLNQYTTKYVSNYPDQKGQGWDEDQKLNVSSERNGIPIGPSADASWLLVVPWGMHRVLHWVARRYDNPPIYITENGVSVPNENNLPLEEALNDQFRIDYYSQYISNVSLALSEGVDVRGYFAWGFIDDYGWQDGYAHRFGLVYVDWKDGLKRYLKNSAKWYGKLVNS